MTKVFSLLCGLSLMLCSTPSNAWKLETHLWQAIDILWESASTGAVLVPNRKSALHPGDMQSVALPPYVRDSLRNHPGEFLVGVLGADIYPDMVGGQMTTHPGLAAQKQLPAPINSVVNAMRQSLILIGAIPSARERVWQTDDWLKWVRDGNAGAIGSSTGSGNNQPPTTSRLTAFRQGYLLHAAMDMWAHTYVNTYSGGVFEILESQEIPARHIALESFIKHKHKNILSMSLPTTLAPGVATFQGNPALANALNPLRAAGVEIRSPLLAARNAAQSTVPSWFRDMHAPVDFVRDRLILNRQVADQYARVESTLHLFAFYAYWAHVKNLRASYQQVVDQLESAYNAAVRSAESIGINVAQLNQAGANATRQAELVCQAYNAHVARVNGELLNAYQNAENGLLGLARSLGITDGIDAVLAIATNPANPLASQFKTLLRTFNDAKSNYETALKKSTNGQAACNLANVRKDFFGSVGQTVGSALQTLENDVERALDAYVRAWEDTAKETMLPKGNRFEAGGDPLRPLKEWVICYAPTFGLPVLASQLPSNCISASNQIRSISDNILQIKSLLAEQAGIKEHVIAFDQAVDSTFKRELPRVADLVSRTIRVDNGQIQGYARHVVSVIDKETPTATALNDEYGDDTSGKNLKVFRIAGGIFSAVMRDFGCNKPNAADCASDFPDEKFATPASWSGFAVLQNSALTSRLALLDGNGLNQIISRSIGTGSSPLLSGAQPATAPTTTLTGSLTTPSFAPYQYANNQIAGVLLLGAVRSIDGDHQWMQYAPTLPNESTTEAQQQQIDPKREFGYGAGSGNGGLRLYAHPPLRACVWNRLMKGPLTPGLFEQYPNIRKNFSDTNRFNSYPSKVGVDAAAVIEASQHCPPLPVSRTVNDAASAVEQLNNLTPVRPGG